MKYMLLFLVVAALMLAGCDRYIDSRDPVRSVPASPPAPTNIQVEVTDQALLLDWSVSDSSNISRYRIYVSDTTPPIFRVHDSSVNSSATLTNLAIDRQYYIQIAPLNLDGVEGDRSETVSATIGYTSIVINAGAQFTRSRDVVIQVNSSAAASQVMLSEDPTFADGRFIPYAPERTFTLSLDEGLKVVYGRLIFSDGSRSGTLLEDGITLDSQAEIDSVFIRPSGVTFAVGETVTFGLDAGELFGTASVTFPGVARVDLFDNGTAGDPIANDGVYYGQYVAPVNTNLFEGTVTGAFTDAAGNSSLPGVADELLNINTPPHPVVLAATLNPLAQLEFTWTLSNEPDFQSYRLYSSPSSPVTTSSTLIANISDPAVSIYVAPPPTTTTYYRIFVFDQHDASVGSNEVVR
ncbi:MAG: fibronectin type III domain-containing protein [Candidatus Zixiibacteriota bacterium]|nr:MAG: fibronectin type III domain-containing protein [candidate division Zixibacteria bacterium]